MRRPNGLLAGPFYPIIVAIAVGLAVFVARLIRDSRQFQNAVVASLTAGAVFGILSAFFGHRRRSAVEDVRKR